MRWDERLAALFDDLEQQAEGLALDARDAEVAELRRAEYAEVELAARLAGSTGLPLRVEVSGVGPLAGVLRRVGAGWCLVDAGAREWVVRFAALGSVRGLADRSVPAEARPVTDRLGLGSALRGVAESRADAVLHRLDGSLLRGPLARVGADFVEVLVGGDREVVPFAALAAVRSA